MLVAELYIYSYNDPIVNEETDYFSNYRLKKITESNNQTVIDRHEKTEFYIKKSLEIFLNKTINKLNFSVSENGKPVLENEACKINIAHKDETLVIAISYDDIAVDIEKINSKHNKIAKRIYNNEKYQKYSNDTKHIIEDWTILEAYVKLYALNILINFKSITIANEIISGPYGDAYYHSLQYKDNFITVSMKKPFILHQNV